MYLLNELLENFVKFLKFLRNFSKDLQNSEKRRNFLQICSREDDILEDLGKCCKMRIWTRKSAVIQPRTSLLKWSFQGKIPALWPAAHRGHTLVANLPDARLQYLHSATSRLQLPPLRQAKHAGSLGGTDEQQNLQQNRNMASRFYSKLLRDSITV